MYACVFLRHQPDYCFNHSHSRDCVKSTTPLSKNSLLTPGCESSRDLQLKQPQTADVDNNILIYRIFADQNFHFYFYCYGIRFSAFFVECNDILEGSRELTATLVHCLLGSMSSSGNTPMVTPSSLSIHNFPILSLRSFMLFMSSYSECSLLVLIQR